MTLRRTMFIGGVLYTWRYCGLCLLVRYSRDLMLTWGPQSFREAFLYFGWFTDYLLLHLLNIPDLPESKILTLISPTRLLSQIPRPCQLHTAQAQIAQSPCALHLVSPTVGLLGIWQRWRLNSNKIARRRGSLPSITPDEFLLLWATLLLNLRLLSLKRHRPEETFSPSTAAPVYLWRRYLQFLSVKADVKFLCFWAPIWSCLKICCPRKTGEDFASRR